MELVSKSERNEGNTHGSAYANVHGVRGDGRGDLDVRGQLAEDVDEKTGSGVVEGGPEARGRRRDVKRVVDRVGVAG
jgi:hypothetical protein